MLRLFRAYAIVDKYRGRDHVCFNFFVHRREKPLAPYEELLTDYKSMDDRTRAYAEGFVNELLTEAEVEELRSYLGDSSELHTEEIKLPTTDKYAPYGALAVGGADGFIVLSEEGDHHLSVSIWAYFRFSEPEIAPTVSSPLEAFPDDLPEDLPF